VEQWDVGAPDVISQAVDSAYALFSLISGIFFSARCVVDGSCLPTMSMVSWWMFLLFGFILCVVYPIIGIYVLVQRRLYTVGPLHRVEWSRWLRELFNYNNEADDFVMFGVGDLNVPHDAAMDTFVDSPMWRSTTRETRSILMECVAAFKAKHPLLDPNEPANRSVATMFCSEFFSEDKQPHLRNTDRYELVPLSSLLCLIPSNPEIRASWVSTVMETKARIRPGFAMLPSWLLLIGIAVVACLYLLIHMLTYVYLSTPIGLLMTTTILTLVVWMAMEIYRFIAGGVASTN
jgi:hypothetical protein